MQQITPVGLADVGRIAAVDQDPGVVAAALEAFRVHAAAPAA